MPTKLLEKKEELYANNFKWTAQPSDRKTTDESSGVKCAERVISNSDCCEDRSHWGKSGVQFLPSESSGCVSKGLTGFSRPEASDWGVMLETQLVTPNHLDFGTPVVTN